ncbi:MAG: site-specific integrase [Maritimibacter sp.]|uniref:tyrosine-type recombinase/integrase n=1 Tax=Maritimibacter sp. TaxID=2003363 RepID=UPI001D4287D9|nr:site-specific integrase [Maritimibacter sp.]MBL6427749.1 site-specific integrase [Maritimibacter sp.]
MPRQRKPARLFQRKDDKAWVILDGGKQIRTGFGDGFRDEAEKALSDYIAQKKQRDVRVFEPHQISIGEILVHYGDAKVQTVTDKGRLVYTIQALAPYWGDMKVSDIDVEKCRRYSVWRKCADWTVRREMNTLNAAIKYAVATRKLTHAPIVTLPPKGVAKDRWLTEEEVGALLDASAPHVKRFTKIALYTGRRKTAITMLKWMPSLDSGWVDLDAGTIHFLGRNEAETKKRKGVVRIPEALLEEMKTWEQDGSNVVSFKGQPITRIDKAFRAATRRAGLDDVTPHTLKHTAVTWAFKRGMTLEDATAYFATSRETLENVYRSYSPDALKNAAGIMNWKL